MFRKSILISAIAIFVGVAHAETGNVEFTVDAGSSTASLTALMGYPSTMQHKLQENRAECFFKQDVDGVSVTSTYSVDSAAGMTTTVLPIERSAKGIKAYVSISIQSAQNQELVAISKDCKLPVGVTSTAEVSLMDTFTWDAPTKLKLSDGSLVVVTARKDSQAAVAAQSSLQESLVGFLSGGS